MRVMLSSEHQYPSSNGISSGRHPREFSSGSGHHLHDLLAKGLSELGHEVLYLLPRGAAAPLPPGVSLISEPDGRADIYHTIAFEDQAVVEYMESRAKPWVTTCHLDRRTGQDAERIAGRNCIFVSETLARSRGGSRYVHNGLDPADYVYSETKDDYFLFMSAMERAWQKGLETAFAIAQRAEVQLVVAGTAGTYEFIQEMASVCERNRAKYVGDVRGAEKAELFAGAKAFLFPTKLNEAFGLVMVEALLSGTPVICSANGACPEVIGPEVGFVCDEPADYHAAVARLGQIKPAACRAFALERYHYLRMAAGYVKEYEAELAAPAHAAGAAKVG